VDEVRDADVTAQQFDDRVGAVGRSGDAQMEEHAAVLSRRTATARAPGGDTRRRER
jgi:hypothetical protein